MQPTQSIFNTNPKTSSKTTAIDLFAGAGGTTAGAKQAGIDVLWAANHNPLAVQVHEANHQDTMHVTQDLHQADWSAIPEHDIAFASPCCGGHSRAAGKKKRSKKADVSRSTAWAVIGCAEYHREEAWVIENVTDFLSWNLFPAWRYAMESLGYSLSFNTVNAKHLGIPQNRERLIIVATQSKHPLELNLGQQEIIPARSIIDFDESKYKWGLLSERCAATRNRAEQAKKDFGQTCLIALYGSEKTGRSMDNPLGTVTTVNKHYLVMGDKIRPLSVQELAKAQSFDESYIFPEQVTSAKHFIGNAVPPKMAKAVSEFILKAA